MKLAEWGDFSQESLKKILENRQGLKLKTDGLTEAEIKRLLLAVGNKLLSFRKSNSQLLSEQNSYYMNLLLLESHLKGLLTENPVELSTQLAKVHNLLKSKGYETAEAGAEEGKRIFKFVSSENPNKTIEIIYDREWPDSVGVKTANWSGEMTIPELFQTIASLTGPEGDEWNSMDEAAGDRNKYVDWDNMPTRELADWADELDPKKYAELAEYEMSDELFREELIKIISHHLGTDSRWSFGDVTSFNNESINENTDLENMAIEDLANFADRLNPHAYAKLVQQHLGDEQFKQALINIIKGVYSKARMTFGEGKISELKVPSKWTKMKHKFAYGSDPRGTVARVKGDVKSMGGGELSRLHTSYQNEPKGGVKGRQRGSPQDIQKRAIDKEFKKRNKPFIHQESEELDEAKNIIGHAWFVDYHGIPGYLNKRIFIEVNPEDYGWFYGGRPGGMEYLAIEAHNKPSNVEIKKYLLRPEVEKDLIDHGFSTETNESAGQVMDEGDIDIIKMYEALLLKGLDAPDAARKTAQHFGIANIDYIDQIYDEWLNEGSAELDEKLSKDQPASAWIHDFVHSKNPKFKGKSEAERRKMALGAYYGAQRESVEESLLSDPYTHPDVEHIAKKEKDKEEAKKKPFNYDEWKKSGKKPRVQKHLLIKKEGVETSEVPQANQLITHGNPELFDKVWNLINEYPGRPNTFQGSKRAAEEVGVEMTFNRSGMLAGFKVVDPSKLSMALQKVELQKRMDKNLADYQAGNVRANWRKESIGESDNSELSRLKKYKKRLQDMSSKYKDWNTTGHYDSKLKDIREKLKKTTADIQKLSSKKESIGENKNTDLHSRILATLPQGSRIRSYILKNPNGSVQVEGAVGKVVNARGSYPDCHAYVKYTREDGRNFSRRLKPGLLEMKDNISEKAVSQKQQKFMGMVYAAKKGAKPASPAVAKVAKGMSKKEAHKFAATKHKGLPKKVGESMSTITEKKPSAGMSKKAKSSLVKKAKAGGDIGKPGKHFKDVEKSAAERYGSEEKGKKVAAAAMWKAAAKKESLDRGDYLKLMRVMQLAEEYDSVPARYLKGIKGLEGLLKEYKSRIDKLIAMNKDHVGLKEEKSNCNKLLRGLDLAKREKLVDSVYLESIGKMNFFIEQVQRSRKILSEGEVEQAQAVLASKDLVDRLQDMLKEVGGMLNEELPPLVDSIRDQIGDAQASQFSSEISGALNQLIDVVRTTREQVDTATRKLAGDEVEGDMDVGGEEPSDMDVKDLAKAAKPVEPEGDEEDGFSGIDAAAGGTNELGRERR